MTALLLETFLVRFRVAREIQLESYSPRHALFSGTKLCAYTASPYIYIAIWHSSTHDNKTHVPYDCILHTKDGFIANDASFYKSN